MKSKSLVLLSIIPLLFACNEAPEEEQVEPEVEENESTHLVDFSLATTGFNNSNPTTFNTKLKNYINGDKDIVSSVTNEGYVQVSQIERVDTTSSSGTSIIHALIPCSGSQDGSVTINFVSTCTKVKIYAQPYYKTFWSYGEGESYVVSSIDAINVLEVNEETWDLTPNNELGTIPDKIEKEFEINSDHLALEAYMSQRVYIHKLEFTFAK